MQRQHRIAHRTAQNGRYRSLPLCSIMAKKMSADAVPERSQPREVANPVPQVSDGQLIEDGFRQAINVDSEQIRNMVDAKLKECSGGQLVAVAL